MAKYRLTEQQCIACGLGEASADLEAYFRERIGEPAFDCDGNLVAVIEGVSRRVGPAGNFVAIPGTELAARQIVREATAKPVKAAKAIEGREDLETQEGQEGQEE